MKKLAVAKSIKNLESFALSVESIQLLGGTGTTKGTGPGQSEKSNIPPLTS